MTRSAFLLSTALVAAALCALPVSLPANAQEDPEAKKRRLEEIERQLETNEQKAGEIREQTPLREEELDELNARLIETADSLQRAETRTTTIEERLVELTADERRVAAELREQQLATSDILAALQSFELAKPPALAVSPEDAAQAARAAMALSGTVPDMQKKVEELRANMELITRLRNDMAAEKEALEQSEVELASRRAVLEDLLDRKTAEYRRVTDTIDQIEAENARLAREATSIRKLLDDLAEAERRREEAREAAAARADAADLDVDPVEAEDLAPLPDLPGLDMYNDLPSAFADVRGRLPYPVSGRIVEADGAAGTRLEGTRLETRGGAVVTAPFNGKVVFARETNGLVGNVFILDVGGGYKIVLVGMASFEAAVGQTVRAGEPLGYMPAEEDRTVLYMEIRRNAEPENPLAWLMERRG